MSCGAESGLGFVLTGRPGELGLNQYSDQYSGAAGRYLNLSDEIFQPFNIILENTSLIIQVATVLFLLTGGCIMYNSVE